MMLIFGLMLLLQTAACLDRFCWFGQIDPCYAALGHKLYLLMVLDTSEYDLKIIKRINNTPHDPVCRVKYGRIRDCDLYNNRPEVTVINGLLIINRVIRADSGNYTLTLDRSVGTETSRDLQVIVEDTEAVTSAVTSSTQTSERVSVVFVLVWCFQLMVLLGLLGAFHIYMRHTSELLSVSETRSDSLLLDFREMMLIFGLMLLLQTAACLDQFCRFGELNTFKQCYAALGHKLNLQMKLKPPRQDLNLYKTLNDGSILEVFSIQKNKAYSYESFRNLSEFLKNVTLIINKHESIRNRSEFFFDNMTLTINNVIRADSGTYTSMVIVIDAVTASELQVIVEAPIGSVEVSTNCSSNQTSVFCSSEGDQLLYNWTLNGKILEQGPMFGNSSIDLDEKTDGNIICSVKNHVSHAEKTIRLKPCPAVSVVFVLVWCFQLMVLLGLLGGFHIYMRHMSGKKQEDQKV